MPTLTLTTLNKHYGKKHALKDFSFTFQNGTDNILIEFTKYLHLGVSQKLLLTCIPIRSK